MKEDNRILQGALMEQHRRIINEIADIKAEKFELTEDDKRKISKLENDLKLVAQRLYVLYNG
jgi:hypothetical protein